LLLQHKRLLQHAKGYVGRAKNCFTIAIRRVEKSWQHAYRDRKKARRNIRTLWIQRCNAGVRQYDWKYSQFIPALEQSQITLNRKTLSQLAMYEPFAFKSVVQVVEQEMGGKPQLVRTN
jgi:large subunit ribosomal protein L20